MKAPLTCDSPGMTPPSPDVSPTEISSEARGAVPLKKVANCWSMLVGDPSPKME